MKTWKHGIVGILAVIALTFIACDDGNKDTHTHDSGQWFTTLEPTCTVTGTKELRCTVDNFVLDTQTIAALGHDWEWKETTAPTLTEEGISTRTCTTCGAEETKPIDKLPACECDQKEHLSIGETCDCGRIDCTCVLKPFGSVSHTNSGTGDTFSAPIYKDAAVSVEQAVTSATLIETGFGSLGASRKNMFIWSGSGGDRTFLIYPIEIWIVAGGSGNSFSNIDGKNIFRIDANETDLDEIWALFYDTAPSLTMVTPKLHDTIFVIWDKTFIANMG